MRDTTDTPKHIGIIMDGNRRWAKSQGLRSIDGHTRGQDVLREAVKYAFENGVSYVSAYVFSTENWRRTEEEVGHLMSLVYRALDKYLDEFHDAGIKLVILGSRERLDPKIVKVIEMAEEKTRNNTKGTLALCFNYGGHQEIVDAAKKLLEKNADPSTLTIEAFEQELYHPEVPPVDLIIRTSGEYRLSGFMLWRASYSELVFIKKHWPEVTPDDIRDVLDEYASRQRRFGK